MYTEHFGLQKELFEDALAQDGDVFLGSRQRLVSANLTIALTRRDSVAILHGPAGVGKTTIASQSLRNMATRLALGWIGTVPLSPHELLEQLLTEFGFSAYRNSRTERLQIWRQFLNEMSITDTRVCVLVENAQDFDVEVLRALESLTARDPNGCPGANIVLTGSAPLRDLLNSPPLAALKQRTRMQAVLAPFNLDETRAYLEHKIQSAGGKNLFDEGAVEALHEYSQGVPRVLNNLCESALTVAAARHETTLSGMVVKRVAEGLFGMEAGELPPPAATPATAAPVMEPTSPAPSDERALSDAAAIDADDTMDDLTPVLEAIAPEIEVGEGSFSSVSDVSEPLGGADLDLPPRMMQNAPATQAFGPMEPPVGAPAAENAAPAEPPAAGPTPAAPSVPAPPAPVPPSSAGPAPAAPRSMPAAPPAAASRPAPLAPTPTTEVKPSTPAPPAQAPPAPTQAPTPPTQVKTSTPAPSPAPTPAPSPQAQAPAPQAQAQPLKASTPARSTPHNTGTVDAVQASTPQAQARPVKTSTPAPSTQAPSTPAPSTQEAPLTSRAPSTPQPAPAAVAPKPAPAAAPSPSPAAESVDPESSMIGRVDFSGLGEADDLDDIELSELDIDDVLGTGIFDNTEADEVTSKSMRVRTPLSDDGPVDVPTLTDTVVPGEEPLLMDAVERDEEPALTDSIEPGDEPVLMDSIEPGDEPMFAESLELGGDDDALAIDADDDAPPLTADALFRDLEASDIDEPAAVADAPATSEDTDEVAALEAFANAKALEDISNSMAETLFGDAELDQLAATLAVATEKQTQQPAEDSDDEEALPRRAGTSPG